MIPDSEDVEAHADDDWIDHLVRFGFVAYGVVHLVVAVLAARLALGDRAEEADAQGALVELARQPFGRTVLWLVAAGMALLVLWRLLEAWVRDREDDGATLWASRAADLAKAGVYAVIAVSAARVASGSGGSGSSDAKSEAWTARLLQLPGGAVLVGAVGLSVIGYGAYTAWCGLDQKHREGLAHEGLTGRSGRLFVALGTAGHVAKGLAIGLVGLLFCYAAITRDPDKSGGLDQALHEVLVRPFGPVLLLLIAVGIGLFGVWCLVRARHLDR